MPNRTACCIAIVLALTLGTASAAKEPETPHVRTLADIIAAAPAAEWRDLDPNNTLYMELPSGRVVIELAAKYAPIHAANINTLVHEKYFDGVAIIRVDDNYVTQWGDPSEDEATAKSYGAALPTLPPEFTVSISDDLPFTRLPDGDIYAPEVGFSDSFPVGRDPGNQQTWLTHCYGAVGVARSYAPDSGNGSGLYTVIGHSPRHLDRNVAVVGRVVQGMELLTALPRGTGPLGFYEKAEQRVPINSVRLAADVPEAQRSHLQVMRSDSESFAAVIDFRRNRHDDFYQSPAGHIELCNVQIPVREAPSKDSE